MTEKGIIHNVLNAKNHEQEAQIISQAGRKGSVTVATNMAGRGVDIKLGGNAEEMAMQKHLKDSSNSTKMNLKKLSQKFKKK